MLYSKNALSSFCSIIDSAENIGSQLTAKTCEIEKIIQRKIPDGVVLGLIKSIKKHPDADKLTVCTVKIDKTTDVSISTGASNVNEGNYVAVATIGTYLSAIDMTIKSRKMRGIVSEGMICSQEELGIGDKSSGIWVINEDLTIDDIDLGKPLAKIFPWLENSIYDVENKTITHRPDLTGHLGIAFELNTIYKKIGESKKIFSSLLPNIVEQFSAKSVQETYTSAHQAPQKIRTSTDHLRGYTGVLLSNTITQKSDLYTSLFLRDMGGQAKNNRIDFSNIFMYLTGQPIHCYDADKIHGEIQVRNAVHQESFQDIHGNIHSLHPEDIVIADDEKILGLAGIIGGSNSAIGQDTTNVLIEIANFDPTQIRKTAKKHNLKTEASTRFEKDINPSYTHALIIQLLDQLSRFLKGNYEFNGLFNYPPSFKPQEIPLDLHHLHTIIDKNKPTKSFYNTAIEILNNLGFLIVDQEKDSNFTITPPIWRSPSDITGSHDVIEEVARIYGYQTIAAEPFMGKHQHTKSHDMVSLIKLIENVLVLEYSVDLIETHPRNDVTILNTINYTSSSGYEVQNPTAPEFSIIRDSLLPNLLQSIQYNVSILKTGIIAEIGNCRYNQSESTHLGILLFAKNSNKELYGKGINIIQKILTRAKIDNSFELIKSDFSYYHPKKQATMYFGKRHIGNIGELHPFYLKKTKIKNIDTCVFCELNITKLPSLENKQHTHTYNTIHERIIEKDISFYINNSGFTNVRAVIGERNSIPKVLKVSISDYYTNQNNQVSITCVVAILVDNPDDTNIIIHNTLLQMQDIGKKYHLKLKGTLNG